VQVNRCSRVTVPRESVYDTEFVRVLSSWLGGQHGWKVTTQWKLRTTFGEHKHTEIILQKGKDSPIVLDVLATGDKSFVESRIKKTPECMDLLSAAEGWVVHFTCEDDYLPVWQSDTELDKDVNVVHFAHDLDFTQLTVHARWKDNCHVTRENSHNIRF
jgi:hypothetical protein